MNLRQIFAEAIQIENPRDREKYLQQACGGDQLLLEQVQQLLDDHVNLGSFLEPDSANTPTESLSENSRIQQPLQSSIGPYRLLEEIGSGGMGVVYLAHQTKPVDRRVALKIIKPGMDTRQVLARFEAERQALALMDHPNIARVLDAGQTESGLPYFVMELVNGVPITEFCDEHHLSTRERLELFVPVCMAVQHAHQKGVIHRDLKPSNILVTLYDDKPVPKIIDFGISKAIHQRLTEQTLFTAHGHIVGTFEYMSPEQATRNQLDVDTRSDVYSLGVVLYELLTGETPLDRKRLRSAAWDEVLRIIREEEPPLASSKVSSSERLPSVAANRKTEPAKLSAFIRGELDWIAAKALEKDRVRRYESASSFASDIRRFLMNEQVYACPPTFVYRIQKFVSRNWKLMSFGSVLLAAIVFGLFGTIWQAVRATKQGALADARANSEKVAREDEKRQREVAEANRIEADSARRDSESRLARLYLERGLNHLDSDPHRGLPWLVEAMRIEPASSPAASAHRLRIQSMIHELPKLLAYLPAKQPVFNKQSTQLAAMPDEKSVVLYSLPAFKQYALLKHEQPVKHYYFSQQGDFLITVAGVERGVRQARLWSAADGTPLSDNIDLTESEYGMKEVPFIHIAPDGKRFTVVWAGMYNRWHSKVVAKVFDRATLSVVSPTFAHHSDLDMINGYQDISQDGMRILLPRGLLATDKRATWENPSFPDDANVVQQYDLMTGKAVHSPLPDIQDFYDFPVYDKLSTKIATQTGGTIHVWNALDGSLLHSVEVPPPAQHMRLTFSQDGNELLAVDRGRALLWELGKDAPIESWGHDDAFAIDKDFSQVIYKSTHGNSYHVMVDRNDETAASTRQLDSYGRAWFSEDGSKYVLEGEFPNKGAENEVVPSQMFESSTGTPLSPPWQMSSTVFHDTLLSSDGRYVVSIGTGLLAWDLSDRQSSPNVYPTESSAKVVAADCNSSRTALAILDSQSQLTVFDTNSEHLLYPTLELNNEPSRDDIVLSPDATQLIQVQDSKRLTLWDLKTGKSIWRNKTLRDSDYWISEIRFIDGGKSICLIDTEVVQSADGKNSYRENLFVEPTTAPTFSQPKRTFADTVSESLGRYAGKDVVIEIQDEAPQSPSTVSSETSAVPQEVGLHKQIHLYDPITLSEVTSPIRLTKASVVHGNLAFTPDGKQLVLADGQILSIPSATKPQSTLTQQTANQVMMRENGEEFLLVFEGGSSLWSPSGRISRFSIDGKSLGPQMISPSSGTLMACYHPTQQVLGSSTSGLRLWDLHTSTPLTRNFELEGQRRSKSRIFFSPNGSRLYSVGDKLAILNFEQLVKSVVSDESLEAWSRILSGKRVDAIGGLVSLTEREFEQSWRIILQSRTNLP